MLVSQRWTKNRRSKPTHARLPAVSQSLSKRPAARCATGWNLKVALAYLRSGDTLVVWKLDRLARSMRQLIDTVEDLQALGE